MHRSRASLPNLNPKKILVCQLRQIGDVLLATPSIRMLKARWPEAEIHVLTERKCSAVLENNPDVAQVHAIDKSLGLLEMVRFYRNTGKVGYDLVVDFQQLPRCKWVLLFVRNAVKLTFTPPWYNRPFYTHWTPPGHGYAAKAKSQVLAPLGLTWQGEPPRIYLSDAERNDSAELFAHYELSGETVIAVAPTHRRITRKWPARHYAGLIRALLEERPDLRFLLLYGPGEREDVDKVKTLAGDDGRIVITEEMLSLREMAAALDQCSLLIGNCSSPRHFAAAVDTPSVVVNGATGMNAWRYPSKEHLGLSKRMECQPCNRNICEHCTCLEEFGPEKVLPMVRRSLDESDSAGGVPTA